MRFFWWMIIFSVSAVADSSLKYQAESKNIKLDEKDKKTLEIGEISNTRYVLGGILGTYPIGLGLGHAVQGRWSDRGWIFTAGELGSAGVFLAGALGCIGDEMDNGINGKDDCSGFNKSLLVGGIIGYVGFRIWEIGDVWIAPPFHNRKYRELKKYIHEVPSPEVKTSLYLVPVKNGSANGLGLKLIF